MPIRTPLDLYRQRQTTVDRRGLLRPMTTGQILDQAVRLMQLHGLKILTTSIFPSILCYTGLIFFAVFVVPTFFATQATGFQEQIFEAAFTLIAFALIVIPIFVIGISFSVLVTNRLTHDYMMGETPDEEAAVEDGFRGILGTAGILGYVLIRSLAFALITIAAIIILAIIDRAFPQNLFIDGVIVVSTFIGGTIGAISPLIILSNLSLAPIVYATEGTSSKQACKRSKLLLKGHGRAVPSAFTTLITAWALIAFVGLLLYGGFQAAYGLFGIANMVDYWQSANPRLSFLAGAINMLPGFFVIWLLAPFYSAILSVVYFDRRVRIEAYDIKVLANDVLKTHRRRSL